MLHPGAVLHPAARPLQAHCSELQWLCTAAAATFAGIGNWIGNWIGN